MRRCFKLIILVIVTICIGFTTVDCGNGGGGGGDGDNVTEESSNWDSMVWGTDKWA